MLDISTRALSTYPESTTTCVPFSAFSFLSPVLEHGQLVASSISTAVKASNHELDHHHGTSLDRSPSPGPMSSAPSHILSISIFIPEESAGRGEFCTGLFPRPSPTPHPNITSLCCLAVVWAEGRNG